MTIRPWEAQRIFGTVTNEVKAPVAITVVSKSESFQISWQKRLGMVDGFIVLVGNSPNELRDHTTIQKTDKAEYSAEIKSLVNGQEYFTSVVAFRENRRSEIVEIWKVIPNITRLQQPADKINAEAISVRVQQQAETQPVTEESKVVQGVVVSSPNKEVPQRPQEDIAAICSACAGDVVLDTNLHLFVCSGCAMQYIQRVVDGKFIPKDSLVNGICECCEPRRPLVQPMGESFKQCSLSGEKYVNLPGNGLVKISSLDYGLCSCCRPPAALILNAQGQVVCSVKRENLYVREGNNFVLRIPDAPPSLLSDIDRALANGSAGMMPNGILISNDGQINNRRRRSR